MRSSRSKSAARHQLVPASPDGCTECGCGCTTIGHRDLCRLEQSRRRQPLLIVWRRNVEYCLGNRGAASRWAWCHALKCREANTVRAFVFVRTATSLTYDNVRDSSIELNLDPGNPGLKFGPSLSCPGPSVNVPQQPSRPRLGDPRAKLKGE